MRYVSLMILLVASVLFCYAGADEESKKVKPVSVSGTINLDDKFSVYFSMPGQAMAGKSEEVSLDANGNFEWTTRIDEPQFFTMTFLPKSRNRQLAASFPVYLIPGKNVKMKLYYDDSTFLTYLSGNLNKDNRALLSYYILSVQKEISLFKSTPDKNNLKEEASYYINTADSLVKVLKIKNKNVQKYLEVWSFNAYQETLERFARANRGQGGENTGASLPKSPAQVYDNEIALLFPSSGRFINQYLNTLIDTKSFGFQALKERVAMAQKIFTNASVKDMIVSRGLEEMISRYSAKENEDFDSQVQLFREIAANIKNEKRREGLINDYVNLMYSQPGAPIPDITFTDLNGKPVSFKSFEGKYIYIDMWASWCVPCIAEIPSLKKLEKDYHDKNIVFLSISVDEDKTAWKNKVKELNLTGHQLETDNSGFEKMMNIQGIPHFILYDDKGKLMMYKAPRPSSTQVRAVLDTF